MAEYFLDLITQPFLLGRKAAVRFNESSLFGVDVFANISAAAIASWMSSSWQTQEVIDVDFSESPEFADVTPRHYGGRLMRAHIKHSSTIGVTLTMRHYPEDVPNLEATGPVPVPRFPRWILQQWKQHKPVALAFLDEMEQDALTCTGLLGNFWVVAAKEERVRGVQAWALKLVTYDFCEWFSSVSIT